jgi:uncharacterized protein YecE (DUF72 family)
MYWIGTSGYDYPEWQGSFYPSDLAAAKRLPYYASQFPTVEINYTFYHLPSERTLAGWVGQTPDGFRLTLKAPKRITHSSRLRGAADLVGTFCALAGTLKDRLGVVLFQLPPFFKKDIGTLDEFLATIPAGVRAAVEFRHDSWLDPHVYARLGARNVALCVADSEKMHTPNVSTATFAYFRLRDAGYTPDALAKWAQAIRAAGREVDDVYVYFKHEEAGKGPEFARTILRDLEVRAA